MQVALGIRDHHGNGELGANSATGKPLVTVDDPVVTISNRRRSEARGVGTGSIRLSHGKTAADVTFEQRHQVSIFLCFLTKLRQDFRITGIRCITVKNARCNLAAPHVFTQHRIVVV